MGSMTQEEINVGLFDECNRLKGELHVMSEEKAELKSQLEALQAHVGRLRDVLENIAGMPSGSSMSSAYYHTQYHNCVHSARRVLDGQ